MASLKKVSQYKCKHTTPFSKQQYHRVYNKVYNKIPNAIAAQPHTHKA